ncbi:MAG: aminoglycoside phosphotransferase family protein [Rickettsiales bacterium]|jgi:thiamine kinase-like enzyme|nr:aminoglycoside phosphotransferase family protein [Rickettsiales bacterium]
MFSLNEIFNLVKGNDWQIIQRIESGWTNFVFEVLIDNDFFVVRFPKTIFFSEQIERDVIASNFLYEKLNIPTSKMQLKYYNDKPYSIHKKLIGNSLDKVMPLTKEQIDKNSIKIAEYFHKIHSCPLSAIPKELQIRQYDILSNLPKSNPSRYDYTVFDNLLKDEKEEKQVFINGDITIKNIICNEDKEVISFIDFSFCGIGDIYTDLAVISCLFVSDYFFNKILEEYEKLSNIKLNREKIQDRIKMRNYINQEYIRFMEESK